MRSRLDTMDEFRTEPSRFLEEPDEDLYPSQGLPPLSVSVEKTRGEIHRRLYQAMRKDTTRSK